MSDLEATLDTRLADALEQFRGVAEEEKGHRMKPWQFQDSETGYLIVARCAQCGAPAKVKFGAPTDLATFPSERLVFSSAALEFRCLNPKSNSSNSGVVGGDRPSIKPPRAVRP